MKTQSIHPRVVGGRSRYERVRTATMPNPDVRAAKIVRMLAHLEEHPLDDATKKHLSKLQ